MKDTRFEINKKVQIAAPFLYGREIKDLYSYDISLRIDIKKGQKILPEEQVAGCIGTSQISGQIFSRIHSQVSHHLFQSVVLSEGQTW